VLEATANKERARKGKLVSEMLDRKDLMVLFRTYNKPQFKNC
jgi:hypothetical protein